jgi:hypothetical protein
MTMDMWMRKASGLAVVTLLATGLPTPAAAQGDTGGAAALSVTPRAVVSSDDVRAVTDLLFLAYPDLTGRPTTLTVNRQDGTLVAVLEDAVTSPAASREPAPEPLLDAVMAFDADGSLRSFVANGVLLDRTRNDAFKAALRAHPDWTDGDAEVQLTALGGRTTAAAMADAFGGRDEARWTRYLGANAHARAASLRLRQRGDAAGAAPAFDTIPSWVRDIDVTRPGGKAAVYELRFEPFGGRLVAVSRQ